jgi:hypothetical protein
VRFVSVQVRRANAAFANHLHYQFVNRLRLPNIWLNLETGTAGVFFVISRFAIVYSSENLFERRALTSDCWAADPDTASAQPRVGRCGFDFLIDRKTSPSPCLIPV